MELKEEWKIGKQTILQKNFHKTQRLVNTSLPNILVIRVRKLFYVFTSLSPNKCLRAKYISLIAVAEPGENIHDLLKKNKSLEEQLEKLKNRSFQEELEKAAPLMDQPMEEEEEEVSSSSKKRKT